MTSVEYHNIKSANFNSDPKDTLRNFDYYLTRTAQIAGVIGAVATLVLLFKR